ncbi:MAG: hypothetical protein E5Y31_15985 [Mesorhizobium sp.]|nr:MAG: hypothetical protein E5Y31_15985 [Mesorhizobium sp.]
MAQEDLDALLSRMDSIAKAVNAFTSEAVQHEAFSALVAAFEGRRHSTKQSHATAEVPEPEQPPALPEQKSASGASNNGKARKATKGKQSSWIFLKDLDLRPNGKKSLEDFVEEKQPASNEDKYAVVVYYFSEVAELPAVSVNHVGSAFRLMKNWREPGDVSASLRITSSRKGTLDTSNLESIKITPTGRNFVEHELPSPPKAKKK